ncbi:hypothetical protein HOY82DRAFT_604960 [Tuber indicum]|nr:hypothetical protein HOY82DRAFT_604960 [Tuber indicum]
MDIKTLQVGQRLIGWHVSTFIAPVIVYFVDKWEKHFPAAVVSILVEKNLDITCSPLNPTDTPVLAPKLPIK